VAATMAPFVPCLLTLPPAARRDNS
jgi:hypothetical protein